MLKKVLIVWSVLFGLLGCGGGSSSSTVTQYQPKFLSKSEVTVEENQHYAITLEGENSDKERVTYDIANGDWMSFNIDILTGEVTFKSLPKYDEKTIYRFTATAKYTTMEPITQSIVIHIAKEGTLKELKFTSPSYISVYENQTDAIILGAEGNGDIRYSISGDDADSFNLNSSTGVVTFKEAPDYKTKTSYHFIATAKDESSEMTQNITIIIATEETVNAPILTVGTQRLTTTQAEVINLHNFKRNIYFQDSNLTYSTNLETVAQVYANTLANNGKFEHDPENEVKGYGENIYAHSENSPLRIADAMPHWFDEEQPLYNYSSGSCQEAYYDNGNRIKCGHYTQVIWQETREVGCATAQYKTGDMKDGFVYVCKYQKAGNSSINGIEEKPYCTNYDNSDMYLDTMPSSLPLAGKHFTIELHDEDRVACTKVDSFNSAIKFSSDLKTAKIEDFEMVTLTYNGEPAKNTLEFDTVTIEGNKIKLTGTNKNIPAEDYQTNGIYMNITIMGETTEYYAVEIEWNALDASVEAYARTMKAKLYK